MNRTIEIEVRFDDDAGIWFVSGSSLSGLSAEAATVDALKARLPGIIADLIECSGLEADDDMPIELVARHTTTTRRLAADKISKDAGSPRKF